MVSWSTMATYYDSIVDIRYCCRIKYRKNPLLISETAVVERKEEELREAYNYFVRNVSEYRIPSYSQLSIASPLSIVSHSGGNDTGSASSTEHVDCPSTGTHQCPQGTVDSFIDWHTVTLPHCRKWTRKCWLIQYRLNDASTPSLRCCRYTVDQGYGINR